MPLVLTNEDVERALDMSACVEALEKAFMALGRGTANNIPRSDILVQSDDPEVYYGFKTMSGAVKEMGVAAVRIDSDILAWPKIDGTPRRTKITASQTGEVRIGKENGLVLLYSIETAELLAILQDGHIQRARVGATSALAADRLARKNARTAGVFGSGYQAEEQIRALCTVRELDEIRVFSPDPEHRASFAAKMTGLVGTPVRAVGTPDEAAEDADILVASTNSMETVIRTEWLRPGIHYNCIKKEEVDRRVLERTDLLFVTANKQTINYLIGEPGGGGAAEIGGEGWWSDPDVAWENQPLLSDLLAGKVEGRTGEDQVTGYIGHGNAIQFAAVGALVYKTAKEQGLGREIPDEWFLQNVYQK